MLFLALKKVRIFKIAPPQVLTAWSKIPPAKRSILFPHWGEFTPPPPLPFTAIWKTQEISVQKKMNFEKE